MFRWIWCDRFCTGNFLIWAVSDILWSPFSCSATLLMAGLSYLEVCVWCQAIQYGNCGRRSDAWIGFSPSTSVFPLSLSFQKCSVHIFFIYLPWKVTRTCSCQMTGSLNKTHLCLSLLSVSTSYLRCILQPSTHICCLYCNSFLCC